MFLLLGFAFAAGLVTILAPCIWPLLPIILSSTTTGGRKKPLGITLGIMGSFAFFTLAIAYLVKIFHLDSNVLRLIAVFIIGFLGLSLVIPALSATLEILVSRVSGKLGGGPSQSSGFWGGLLTGFSLGIIWSPCAGPILATIAALAATQAVSLRVVVLTLVYVSGVGVPLFIFASAGTWLFTRSRALSQYTGRIQQVFGVIMILTAISIYTNYDKVLQANLLNAFPVFSSSLTSFESNETLKKQLDALKPAAPAETAGKSAPDFVGITKWLNVPSPISMKDLRGKVVLVDFWTYTCINCIRTLPHLTAWYDKYKDAGLVIVGVHTPEFQFEKETSNVEKAIQQYGIHYPVAQDNDYATWRAYNNEYWPAEYLIDAKGDIRHTHFGEGEYDETEKAIRNLLREAGNKLPETMSHVSDNTPTDELTPETYLGSERRERFSNDAKKLPLHHFALDGSWTTAPEFAAPNPGASLRFHFDADKVFLVMKPVKAGASVQIELDGKPKGSLNIDADKLYTLVDLKGKPGEHTLRLRFQAGQVRLYAFTFG